MDPVFFFVFADGGNKIVGGDGRGHVFVGGGSVGMIRRINGGIAVGNKTGPCVGSIAMLITHLQWEIWRYKSATKGFTRGGR